MTFINLFRASKRVEGEIWQSWRTTWCNVDHVFCVQLNVVLYFYRVLCHMIKAANLICSNFLFITKFKDSRRQEPNPSGLLFRPFVRKQGRGPGWDMEKT